MKSTKKYHCWLFYLFCLINTSQCTYFPHMHYLFYRSHQKNGGLFSIPPMRVGCASVSFADFESNTQTHTHKRIRTHPVASGLCLCV